MYQQTVYADERDMLSSSRLLIICVALLALLLITPRIVTSQPSQELQPRFSRAFTLVHQAEAAGATREEVTNLVVLLNKALQLNEQATRSPASEAKRRADLLGQANETLGTVETEASQLEVVAAHRTFNNRVLAYVSGGITALVSTVVYVLGVGFWRRYRIKRTFQMRVFRKRVEQSVLSK
jgi:hypothetical protein